MLEYEGRDSSTRTKVEKGLYVLLNERTIAGGPTPRGYMNARPIQQFKLTYDYRWNEISLLRTEIPPGCVIEVTGVVILVRGLHVPCEASGLERGENMDWR